MVQIFDEYRKGKEKQGFRKRRPYRKRNRRFRGGECVAATRAFTAAERYSDGKAPTLAAAAVSCGCCTPYVRAAIVILNTENTAEVSAILRGQKPLLKAAREAKHLAGLVKAYRTAPASDHVAFAKIIGAETLFDTVISPAI